MKNYPLFFLLGGLLICAFLADIAIGSVNLSLSDVWATLTGNSDNLIYHEIILNHRLPKAITAILAGGALSVAGVLMQTLFHNPLAGPDVLGVTSGASLGVALLTLGTSTLPLWLITGWGQVLLNREDLAYDDGVPTELAIGELRFECTPDQSRLIQGTGKGVADE